MNISKATDPHEESVKDAMHEEIVLQLNSTLAPLRDLIGDLKFEKRIKKAAKILCKGIKAISKVSPIVVVPLPIVNIAENKLPAKKINTTKTPVKKAAIAAPLKKTKKVVPLKSKSVPK